MKKLSLLLTAVLLLTSCGGTSTDSDTIKIGFVGPLSGDAANYGVLTQDVVKMQVAKINSKGGIDGRLIKMIYEDDRCTPVDAVKAINKLVGVDHVKVVIGSSCSGATLAMAPIVEANQALLMSPISSSSDITTAGDFVFRTIPSDASQSQVLADYADQYVRVGMLVEQTDYAVGIADGFEDHYSGEVIRKSFLSDETDLKTVIAGLASSEVEAIVAIPQASPRLEVILKQLKELNWSYPIIVNEAAEGALPTLQANADFYANNLILSKFAAPNTDSFTQFAQDYTAQYGHPMVYPNYGACTLDSVEAVYQSLLAVGEDAPAIRDYLYDHSFMSEAGRNVSFDANGDIEGARYELYSFDGSDLIPLTN